MSMTDLLASLTDDQAFLLRCAWKPFMQHHQWPIFDYVEAECDRQRFNAREVLGSLPSPSLPSVAGFRYGPVWYNSPLIPADDASIQLRVLGLWHVAEPLALEIADAFIAVLNYLIERRLSAPYEPFKLNTVTVTNADISARFPGMPVLIISFLAELLSHEPPTYHGTTRTDTSRGINVYRSILKYQGLETSTDYLKRVNELLTPPEVEPTPVIPSPLDLVATLDYFNAVWQLHFDRKRPLIRLFGAERTARLVYEANTAEEFSSQVSCLTDIFKNMQIAAEGKVPLVRLGSFLRATLPEDSFGRVDNAVATLGHVANVRNALFQHSGTEYRGMQALAQLGVEYPITDWQSAWATVQRRTIDAFNALREEIDLFHEVESD
jgi:hypothetical protein